MCTWASQRTVRFAAQVLSAALLAWLWSCGSPPPARAPGAEPTEPTKPEAAAPTQQVYVTVDADDPAVILMRVVEGEEEGQPVCQMPCNQYVEAAEGEHFYFAGHDVQPSGWFVLYEPDDPIAWLEADVAHGSTDDILLGLSLGAIMAGGAAMLAGFIATPTVDDESWQTAMSAVGATGLGLTVVVGLGLQLPRLWTEATSSRFRDPMLHPTLRESELPPKPTTSAAPVQ